MVLLCLCLLASYVLYAFGIVSVSIETLRSRKVYEQTNSFACTILFVLRAVDWQILFRYYELTVSIICIVNAH